MDGFLTVSKPAGITSHDVVSRVRRVFEEKRVGHGGTLDPAATGLLVVGIGKATRLFPYVKQEPKVYEFTIVLGIETDTYDSQGKVTAEIDACTVTRETLESAVAQFRGEIQQVPPMYSAVHSDGHRLYELARQGIEVERAPRAVTVYGLDMLDFEAGPRAEGRLRCGCSSGTYMRSLCHDIGAVLGVGGHMGSLSRLTCGDFRLDDATPLDAITADTPFVAMRDALPHLYAHTLNAIALERVLHGAAIRPARPPESELVCLLDDLGRMIALAHWEPPVLQPLVVVG